MDEIWIENWLVNLFLQLETLRGIKVPKAFFDLAKEQLAKDKKFNVIWAELASQWILYGRWPISKEKLVWSDFFPRKEDVEIDSDFVQGLYTRFLEIEHKILKQMYREKYDKMCLEWQNYHTPEKFTELVEQKSEMLLEKLKLENDLKDLQKQNADQDKRYAQLFKENARITANYNALITNRLEDVEETLSVEEMMDMEN